MGLNNDHPSVVIPPNKTTYSILTFKRKTSKRNHLTLMEFGELNHPSTGDTELSNPEAWKL